MEALTRPPSVLDTVYEAIRDSICNGELAPGERLTQDELALQLGVSRQPVGQALILLKSQGFVSDAGRRGVVVAPLDPHIVEDIYAIRGAIDALSARLAATRAGPDDLAEGEAILAEGKRLVAESGSVDALVKADIAFHDFIYALSGNRLVRESLASHWQHLRRAMAGVIEHGEYRQTLWKEHEQILAAIKRRDAEGAAALSRAHVEAASRELRKKLTKRFATANGSTSERNDAAN